MLALGDFKDFSQVITIGTTHRFRLQVTVDAANGSGPSAEDISAWDELWFTIKKEPWDAATLLRLSTRDGTVTRIAPTAQGICEIVIDPTQSATIPNFHQVLYADFQGRDAAGDVWELARGTIITLPRIGQPVAV